MESFRFLKFPVYIESKSFYKSCCVVIRTFPHTYNSLSDQQRRASLSVCLNIAEGSAKYSDRDFHRYLENSQGSLNEAIALLEIAREAQILTSEDFEMLFNQATNIANQLGGLSKKLRSARKN